ncbi:DUF4386 domain-containing protein [Cohnella yongneupensis]|uniref:DUF4386 domain-containing protein n=1 Tax=Cohnella yongneupensis TaxID=425006 RepID=A0ABW0QXV8_9BACL
MNAYKHNARIAGILFILAAVTSIIGLLLYNPLLNESDYLIQGSKHANEIVLGAINELILAVSVVGISILLYPLLKKQNESLALGYVCFRLFEAVVVVVGVISMLSLLTLSQHYVDTAFPGTDTFEPVGTVLIAVHDWTFLLGPNFLLGVNTMMCAYLLYKSRFVPRFIAYMGLTGATLVFVAALLEMFGVIDQLSSWGAILALPVFAYEMTFATWLIVKGFNTSSVAALSAKMDNRELAV